ncbi:beta-N-acetylhexosaminidase [Marinifilum flexuosum]|uniref:beta-N-acetylhexosaminidase n=1 Tax=Marinifilum flexuosum TaxID=1117708 RepID=A0A419X3Z4_9BACT|nr:beta-N-acetylhexosaminidase [Marinifilum flexuosum]RKE02423.1 hexosaminidase [Marinifilum flexuosum]
MKNLLLTLACFFTLASCNNKMKDYVNSDQDYTIIPKPIDIQVKNGRFIIDQNTKVTADKDLEVEAQYLAEILSLSTGKEIQFTDKNTKGNINLIIDSSLESDEAYILSVDYNKVKISGKTAKGIFYGIQSLRQLIQKKARCESESEIASIPATLITDAPRYAYRGMHLDVARHFFSVDFIKRYIDILAMHKMNSFHWHLTEDQGWRIEIKKYPKLTEVGALRNGTIVGNYPGSENDNLKYGGYYTQEEVKEVIAYAAKNHITVIPEIELPGHSSAAIAAYPFLSCFPKENSIVPKGMISEGSKKAQRNGKPKIVQESWGVYDDVYCAGKEETFEVLENILSEVIELFPSKYIHIGGDECPKGNWKRCSLCQKRKKEHGLKDEHELQSYFIQRIEKFVNSKGKNIIGWDEILEGGLAPNATVMSWRGNKGGIEAANADHNVIMSPNSHCYFDHYQAKDRTNEPIAIGGFLPVEKVYSFDPTPDELEASKHKYILGGQANLWTEYIGTEEYAEYMLLPRLTALSESLWSQKKMKNWDDFKVRLSTFRKKYDELGLNYAKHVFKDEE